MLESICNSDLWQASGSRVPLFHSIINLIYFYMMRISLKTRIVCLQLCLTLASTLQAADKFVSFIREEGTLELVTSQQRSFSILCADEEHKGVLTAGHNFLGGFF